MKSTIHQKPSMQATTAEGRAAMEEIARRRAKMPKAQLDAMAAGTFQSPMPHGGVNANPSNYGAMIAAAERKGDEMIAAGRAKIIGRAAS